MVRFTCSQTGKDKKSNNLYSVMLVTFGSQIKKVTIHFSSCDFFSFLFPFFFFFCFLNLIIPCSWGVFKCRSKRHRAASFGAIACYSTAKPSALKQGGQHCDIKLPVWQVSAKCSDPCYLPVKAPSVQVPTFKILIVHIFRTLPLCPAIKD